MNLHVYRDEDEAMLAYNDTSSVSTSPSVSARSRQMPDGTMGSKVVRVTIGRIIFNRNIPQDLGFVERVDETASRPKTTSTTRSPCLRQEAARQDRRPHDQAHGFTIAAEVLDNIKATATSTPPVRPSRISIADMTIPPRSTTSSPRPSSASSTSTTSSRWAS